MVVSWMMDSTMKEKTMKPRTYDILRRAVEEGTAYGVGRAYKHNDSPSREELMRVVETAIMTSICEVFDFEPQDDTDH
jgi:hypothetical protein